jgi:hypothetical protein
MIKKIATVALVMLLSACERANRSDTAQDGATTAGTPGAVRSPSVALGSDGRLWDDSLGAIVAMPSMETGAPLLFVRDTLLETNIEVELFTHEARTTRAIVHPQASPRLCPRIRSGQLLATTGQSSLQAWSFALTPGVGAPLAIEGTGDISPKDSAAESILVSKLVSALPDDSASLPYRGLPIVVRDVWRVVLPDKTIVLVAIAMRSINVESNPRAQVVTIVAEPDLGNAGAWKVDYLHRNAGPEDRVEGADLLAAVLLHGIQPMLAFVREGDRVAQVDLVERTGSGVWRRRWSSDALSCAR